MITQIGSGLPKTGQAIGKIYEKLQTWAFSSGSLHLPELSEGSVPDLPDLSRHGASYSKS